MKIVHLLRSEPSDFVKKIIETQSKGNDTKVINLSKKEATYESIIEEIASSDKVMSW